MQEAHFPLVSPAPSPIRPDTCFIATSEVFHTYHLRKFSSVNGLGHLFVFDQPLILLS